MARHTPPDPSGVPERRLRALPRPAVSSGPAPAPEDVPDHARSTTSAPVPAEPPPPPYAAAGLPTGDDGLLGAPPPDEDAPDVDPPPPPPYAAPRAPLPREAPDSGDGAAAPEPGGTGPPEPSPQDRTSRAAHGTPDSPPPRLRDDAPPPGYVEVFPDEPAADRRSTPLLGALLDRLLPQEWDDRPRLGRSGVSALAAVCLLAAGVTGWFMLNARPESAPAPPHAASPSGAAPSASTSPSGTVVVHVGGEVESPGVVTLPAGARVADAIEAAGGLRSDADPGLLNLARPLVDGEQVLVGVTPSPEPVPQAGAAPSDTTGRVDLNTATAEQLQTLPGVGPVLAQRIIDHRESNGGFTSVEQLHDVTGIGERRFAELRDLVHVGGAS